MSLTRKLGETLSVGAGCLCWMLIILLWLPWLESSTWTSLSTPMIPTLWWEVGYRVKSTPLLLRQWPLLLGCLWSSILSILTISLFPLMTSCHILLGLLSSGVLILGSPLTSWLRFIIYFFWISCHLIWRISHLHTIPLERCAFLYALVIDWGS